MAMLKKLMEITEKFLVAVFLVSAVLYTNFFLQNTYKNKDSSLIKSVLYLPSGEFLKGASLCYDEVLGDFLWIKAIGYFGSHSVKETDYDILSHIIQIINVLDPYFQYPYEFGGISLGFKSENIDKSIEILENGMKNVSLTHERYWYFPFFLAFNYMYHKQDYKTAADYLEQAIKFPQSPPYLPLLASRLYAKANSPENAIPFLKEMINNTDNEKLKNLLTERLKDIINEKNILFLEKAVAKYHEKYNKYPYDIIELKKSGIINQIPEEPFGGNYYYSIYDNSVISSTKPERLKLYIKPKK